MDDGMDGADAMAKALLEVAEIELRGCDSMDPAIVLGRRDGGRLTAYSHLRLLPGETGPFPFDAAPARRAFHRDGIDLYGIAYGVWRDRAGRPTALPDGFPGRQAGVMTIIGRRGATTASVHPIAWENGRFAGFGTPQALAAAPVGDLLSDPGERVVIPFEPRSPKPRKDPAR